MKNSETRELFERALVTDKGIVIRLKDMPGARAMDRLVNLRQRLYTFRKNERKRSTKLYDENDPQYDRSAYDCVSLTLDTDDQGPFLRLDNGDSAMEQYDIKEIE